MTPGDYLRTVQNGVAKAQEAAATFEQAKAAFDQIKCYLSGTGVSEPAIRVTSGKSVSFWAQIWVGTVSSVIAVINALNENWVVALAALFVMAIIAVTVGIIFYKYNAKAIDVYSDPNKFNVK